MLEETRNTGITGRVLRCRESGIAFTNSADGDVHTVHPGVPVADGRQSLVRLGYWNKEDKVVNFEGVIYNRDKVAAFNRTDHLIWKHCRCGGKHCRDLKGNRP